MKTFSRILLSAVLVSGLSLWAQDEEEETEETAEAAASEDTVLDVGGVVFHRPAAKKHNYFHTLPLCKRLEGTAQVLKPGARDWSPIEEGDHYPLGSSFRTVGKETRLTISFGPECSIVIIGEASFGSRNQPLGVPSRAIYLKSGIITVRLPRNLPEGLFSVSAPGFTVVNPAGDSRYRYKKTGDGDEAVVRCVTGTLAVEGRHFRVLSMRAANEVKIRTSQDALFTGIYGTRGDYLLSLDQGQVKITDPASGESHIEEKKLEWKMSPQTAVRIHRAVPKIGDRMSVTTMTFDATGAMKNRCAFTEGRYEINSGELAPTSKANRDDLAKKAAEATDMVPAEAEGAGEDEAGEDGSESSDSEGESSAADDDDLEF